MPEIEPCPFCGGAISFRCVEGMIAFECDIDSPCFYYALHIFCAPSDFKASVHRWNNRPLEIRARMAAINEAATVAGNWNGRNVNAGYAIKSKILDLKRQRIAA